MRIDYTLLDEAVLTELGARLAHQRVSLGITQAALSRKAGVGKRTLERLEAGMSVQATSLVRIMRALDLMENLDALIPEEGPRPMELLKLKGKTRQRAPRAPGLEEGATWTWGDDA